MLTEVCDYIHNYFDGTSYHGNFVIENGTITEMDGLLVNGQRFRVIGSALNDGIYTWLNGSVYDDDGKTGVVLKPETFSGTVTAMNVPISILYLVEDISDWVTKNKAILDSPYTSESFGGYSYSKASGSGSNAGGVLGWQDMFRTRLNAYRKIS